MAFGELLPPVIAKLMGDISDFQAKMMTAQGEMTKTEATGSAAFTKLAAAGKVAFLAIGALAVGVGVESVKLADDFEKAHANLQTAVVNSGHKMKEFTKTIDLQHKSFENLGYSNTEYEAALGALTTATNSPTKALQYMGVVADFAATAHKPLEDAALAVGKALAGNLRPLKQLGLDLPFAATNAVKLETAQKNLTKAQEALTEAVAKHGPKSEQARKATEALTEAQDKVNKATNNGANIVAVLGARLEGSAARQAETFGGKLKVMEAKLQDVGIKIGLWLIPKLQELASAIGDGISWLEKHKTVAEALGITLGVVLVAAIGAYTIAMVQAAVATLAATWPIIAVGIVLAALVAAAVWVWTNWNQIWNWIKDHPAYAVIAGVLASPIAAFILIIGGLKTLYENWDSIWSAMSGPVQTVLDIVNGVIDALGLASSKQQDFYGSAMTPMSPSSMGPFIPGSAQDTYSKNPGAWIGPPPLVPKAADGGYVAKTGMAIIHKGETITPASQVGGGGDINITINGGLTDRKTVDYMIEQIRTKIRVSGSQGLS
jgi:hypothetical protein